MMCRFLLLLAVSVSLSLLGLGCGGGGRVAPSLEDTAKEKLKALQTLATELAKSPDGAGAQGALEQFRIMELDPAKNPKEAQEMADLYRQKIQGKYRGQVATELHNEMLPYLKKK